MVTIFIWCMCMPAYVHPSGFVRAITYTFMHGFQNNLAQLLPLFIGNNCLGKLKVKVTLVGQTIKWSLARVNIIN